MRQSNFDNCCVVNIGPYAQTVEMSYGRFKIDACPKELPYTVLVIRPATERYDLGDDRKGTEWWEPRVIANDIVNANGLGKLGVFVAEGPRPTREELAKAKGSLEGWYHLLVAEGDAFYAANRDVARNGITDNHRKAVLYFGQTRDWAYVPSKLLPCPFCTEMVRPGATMCKHCNAVLNIDKAIAAGLVTVQQGDLLKKHRKKLKEIEDAEHKGTIEAPRAANEETVGLDMPDAEDQTPAARQALERGRRARTHEAQNASAPGPLDEVLAERHVPTKGYPEGFRDEDLS